MSDFFISYNSADKAWAEWIAWTLEEAGHSTIVQAWHFRPGTNFVLQMDNAAKTAERTIAVLSPSYLRASFPPPEWAAAFARDPEGRRRTLVPVRVQECDIEGLLRQIVYVDLVGVAEEKATEVLLAGVQEVGKPEKKPSFPGEPVKQQEHGPRFPGSYPSHWNIPQNYRNFTGREEVLRDLRNHFLHTNRLALTEAAALSGLGGIGKTETAIEYAHRHRADYEAAFWVLADTRENFVGSLQDVANLVGCQGEDSEATMRCLWNWFRTNRTPWLLILDNVDNLDDVDLPEGGHVLLTSRLKALGGVAKSIPLDRMDEQDALAFLCKRTGRPALSQTEEIEALELSKELGYLPLALELAAAHIEANEFSFADFRTQYNKHGLRLLDETPALRKYPREVVDTWAANLTSVQHKLASAELLNLSSFLASDDIPFRLLLRGTRHLGDILSEALLDLPTLKQHLEPLAHYSLIRVHDDSYSIHRLVQEVHRETLQESETATWLTRSVDLLAAEFPDPDLENWPECEVLLPHALAVLQRAVDDHDPAGVSLLCNDVGVYLDQRARYVEAESLLRRALETREKTLGPNHLDTSTSLLNLASLLKNQGKYAEAEPLMRRALDVRLGELGPSHPQTGTVLNGLASLLDSQGRLEEAERLYRRALQVLEETVGPRHPQTATVLSNLATLYGNLGKYDEAELLLGRALAVREKELGPEHPDTAASIHNLASVLDSLGKFTEAELLYRYALEVMEKALGTEHPHTATTLHNLASLFANYGKYQDAEPLFRRAFEVREKTLGPEHAQTAQSLGGLGVVFKNQGRCDEAERSLRRALEVQQNALGPEHPDTAATVNNLGLLLCSRRRFAEAEPLLRRALETAEKILGPEHPHTATAHNNLALLFDDQDRLDNAEQSYNRALEIAQATLGPEHPLTRTILENLKDLADRRS